jgi:rubrerythrin
MEKRVKEILEGLKTAMEAELTGHTFYKTAAENTNNPLGNKTFSRMADEEMGHFKYLRHQYKSVLQSGEYDRKEKLTKKGFQHAGSPIFSDEIKKRIKESHFEVTALTIGMKLELEARKYYRSCAEKADLPEAKAFFTELADWEEDHYHAFEEQLDQLKGDYFAANHFYPM